MWVCVIIGVVIIFLAKYAGKLEQSSHIHDSEDQNPPKEETKAEEKSQNSVFDGAKLVFSSKYLLAIAGIVGLYEIVSTLMDFQFTSTIEHYLDGAEIGKQFATVFTITNVVSMFVQLFLTSFIMTRFGVTKALMFLPVAVLIGSAGFIAVPVLWVGSLLNTADNGFSYSINQSAKETLYVPTTREEKYKAKAFIDMFVQRFAKAVAVLLSLSITVIFADFSSVRWLSIAVLLAVISWIFIIRFVGKRFDELAAENVQ